METIVRQAINSDLDWVLIELKKFSEFFTSAIKLFPDERYARDYILNMFETQLFLVAERGNELVGLVAGTYYKHPFNPEITVLSEMFWWVPEQYRTSFAGSLLLKEFMKHGKQNADWIQFTLEHNSPVDEQSLLKRGFKMQEKSYLLEVTPWQH